MKLIFEELKMSTKHIIWFSCYINDKTKVGAFPCCCRLLGLVSLARSDYEACLSTGQVVSDVFCLPTSYRKDVPPSSETPHRHVSDV